jgi:glutamate racemase
VSGARRPIGVFDSGVGGLSVWREIVRLLPHESTVYLADQAHVPYGPRPQDEVARFSAGITEHLLERGCKAVVVACNTASAAALKDLRARFAPVPIIGLEPAVKPAAAMTKTGVIGVMATPATFAGRLYQATVGRHAASIRVVSQTCPGLADLVERGALDGPEAEQLLRGFVQPILAENADVIVLGCTHYPFVIDGIRRIAGPSVAVLDPAPSVARHLGNVLAHHGLGRHDGTGAHHFLTTADPAAFAGTASRLLDRSVQAEPVHWVSGTRLV